MNSCAIVEGTLACPQCRRLHYTRDEAMVRAELVPGEVFEEWLRCARCGTPSSAFRAATAADLPRRVMSHVVYECVVEGQTPGELSVELSEFMEWREERRRSVRGEEK